jgi:hypothetical protein
MKIMPSNQHGVIQGSRRRSWGALILVCLICSLLGFVFCENWLPSPAYAQTTTTVTPGGVDAVPPGLELAEKTYLQYCATCHVGVPPQVLPSQTWQALLTDSQHYGIPLPPLPKPDQSVIINYIAAFAYPFKPEETVPFRVGRSRFFRILHPQVQLPQPVKLEGCISCHPGAMQFNYRRLSSEWQ